MSDNVVLMLLQILCASAGFWSFVTVMYQNRKENRKWSDKMLIGLGHDRILSLGNSYIDRGWVTSEEYENLSDYLFKPYKAMGGNGAAERIMEEVRKLPMKKDKKVES